MDLAERTGLSRSTIEAIERGSSGTAVGAYVRVLWVMGLDRELDVVADPALDQQGAALEYKAGSGLCACERGWVMTSEIWVWSWLPGDTAPTLAGRLRHMRLPGGAPPRYRGEFVYGRSYLTNPDALPFEPAHLRLVERLYETATLEGFFGPVRDAMPGDWGRYVIDREFGPQNDLTAPMHSKRQPATDQVQSPQATVFGPALL